jgi:acetyl esterase
MPLDPQLADVIVGFRDTGAKGFEDMTPEEAREAVMEMLRFQAAPPEMAETDDYQLPGHHGLRLRIYRPHGTPRPAPVVLFFHGGGWTVGNIEFADAPVRELAAASHSIWVSANYRLAPEHPFPAALDDAWAALEWLQQQLDLLGADPRRLAVAGESSGANLCAALALRTRDRGGPVLAHQYLLFPPLGVNLDTESYRTHGHDLLLTRAALRWFWCNYVGSDLGSVPPEAAPLNAPDLTRVAPTTIVVAEYDALRDDGIAYARRLREASVPTSLIEWKGMTHGAFQMTGAVDRVPILMQELGGRIRAVAPAHDATVMKE